LIRHSSFGLARPKRAADKEQSNTSTFSGVGLSLSGRLSSHVFRRLTGGLLRHVLFDVL